MIGVQNPKEEAVESRRKYDFGDEVLAWRIKLRKERWEIHVQWSTGLSLFIYMKTVWYGSILIYVLIVDKLTNKIHVAVRLFSNRSQMTSKCGKNKKVAHEPLGECVTNVLTTFWRLLWRIMEQTHGNMESIVLYNREVKKLPLTSFMRHSVLQ